ncbi:metallophosphoesterase [Pseudoalteromonas aurantia]|nr:metallophosphoesterase [Pseudoalteromonas aurantia]
MRHFPSAPISIIKHIMLLLLICVSCQSLAAFSDGPYVTLNNKTMQVEWVCNNQMSLQTRKLTKELKFNQCGMTLNTQLQTPSSKQPAIFSNIKKYAALSDVHGQFSVLKTLLVNHNIIDSKNQWAFGAGHLIITGDIFDRGPDVTDILWFLYDLETQAKKANGQLHLLLGNHEVMVLNNDDRYLHEKYVKTEQQLGRDIDLLYASNTVLGQWLRSKNVILKLNNALFMHGGLPASFAHDKVSIAKINAVFSQYLVNKDRPQFAKRLFGRNGPIWYRGYFSNITDNELSTLLDYYQVEHIVVGHTSQSKVKAIADNKVIAIDSSIKHGKQGELLLFKNNALFRGKYNGDVELLVE